MPRTHLDPVFVDRVIDILERNINGVTKNDFLHEYYSGSLPSTATCDQTWERLKKVELYSNAMFNARVEGFLWIRARRGVRNTFYYHAVAKIEHETFKYLIPEVLAYQLDGQHTSEWKTRTKTKMRSTVAAAEQFQSLAIKSGDPKLMKEADERFSEIMMISTRLAAVNFGDGIVLDDLTRLEASANLSLLRPQIRRARQALQRAQEDVNELARTVMELKRIAQPAIRRELEQ